MAISEDNTRVFITIPKDLHNKCKIAASKEIRSFSNYVIVALKEKIERDK